MNQNYLPPRRLPCENHLLLSVLSGRALMFVTVMKLEFPDQRACYPNIEILLPGCKGIKTILYRFFPGSGEAWLINNKN